MAARGRVSDVETFPVVSVYNNMPAKKTTVLKAGEAMATCRAKRCPTEKIKHDIAVAATKKKTAAALAAVLTKKIDKKGFDDRMERILKASFKVSNAQTCTFKKCNSELLAVFKEMLSVFKADCQKVPNKEQREALCARIERVRKILDKKKTLSAEDRSEVQAVLADIVNSM